LEQHLLFVVVFAPGLRFMDCQPIRLLVFLIPQAVETLKSFEKKDTKVAAAAATNLAFLYSLVSNLTDKLVISKLLLDLVFMLSIQHCL
jgi:hypothetical protein